MSSSQRGDAIEWISRAGGASFLEEDSGMGDASNSKDGDGNFHVGGLKEESFVQNWIVLPSMYKKRTLCLKKRI